MDSAKTIWVFLVIAVAGTQFLSNAKCPKNCECPTEGFVNCSKLELTEIPRNIPPSTTSLDVSINNIRKVSPGDLRTLVNLQSLDISQNPLTYDSFVNGSFSGPRNLTTLRLDTIDFPKIPRMLPRSLQFLQMIECGLVNITKEDFLQFDNMQVLDFSYNKLTSLSKDTFVTVPSLLALFLEFNKITSDGLPDGIFNPVQSLQTLVIRFNPIGRIPTGLPSTLKDLDLVGLGIKTVPSEVFSNLHHLHDLALWSNAITSIEERAFIGLYNLTILELFQNQISSPVTNLTFVGLDAIGTLDVSGNHIPSVAPGAIQWFKEPTQIWFGDNNITTLDSGMESTFSMPSMQMAYLIFNPWYCDCKLKWLKSLQDRDEAISDPHLMVCAGPPNLKGKAWDTLSAANFTCP